MSDVNKLVEALKEAFFEGFAEGSDGGWVEGDPTPAWKKSAALAAAQGAGPSDAILPDSVRQWPFYVVPMPFTAEGKGPATIGKDAASIQYEVWDAVSFLSVSSHEHLPDAINESIRLSIAALNQPRDSPAPEDLS